MTLSWRQRLGAQRDWLWRGWQIRYCFCHPPNPSSLPPLILLHGFGVSLEHWRDNISTLSEKTSVYALDLLGFGGSRKANTPYSAYLWAEQVYEFWRQVIGVPVVVVGNSIGALVAMALAYQYPEMVTGLAMLSLPDVSLRQSALPPWLQSLANSAESLLAPPWLLKTVFRLVRQPKVIRPWVSLAYCDQTAVDEELAAIISRPPQDIGAEDAFYQLFNSVRQPGFSPPARTVLPQLCQPILLIWGEQDRLVPSALATGFAGLNAQIQLELWAGVGHCPQDERPAQFNQTLLAWLQERF